MVVAVAMTFSASAATIHRSFKSRDVGFGGGASVSVPVETKIAQALDAVAEKEAARTKVQKGVCPLCGKKFSYEEMHGDHIKDWSQGGQTTHENGQMLCHDCNWTKGKK